MGTENNAEKFDATNDDAKYGRDDLAGDFENQIWPDWKVRAALVLRAAFPGKTHMAVVQYCGCPERTARNYTSAHSEPPWSILDTLLVGAEGDKILHELMRGREPAWYRRHMHGLKVLAAIEEVGNGEHVGRDSS